jgi:hypothetical protein
MAPKDTGTPGTGDVPPPSTMQYEFSADQNQTIDGVAWGFKIMGYVFTLACLKIVVRLVRGGIYLANGTGRPVTDSDMIEYACLLVLFLPLTVWMFQSWSAFQAVVETKGRDIDHLMQGLGKLRRSFGWVIGVAILALITSLVMSLLN